MPRSKKLWALSPEQRKAMGRNGRALVERKYQWGAIAEQMTGVYRDIVSTESSQTGVLKSDHSVVAMSEKCEYCGYINIFPPRKAGVRCERLTFARRFAAKGHSVDVVCGGGYDEVVAGQ